MDHTGARRLGAFALRPGPRGCPWRRTALSPDPAGAGLWGDGAGAAAIRA